MTSDGTLFALLPKPSRHDVCLHDHRVTTQVRILGSPQHLQHAHARTPRRLFVGWHGVWPAYAKARNVFIFRGHQTRGVWCSWRAKEGKKSRCFFVAQSVHSRNLQPSHTPSPTPLPQMNAHTYTLRLGRFARACVCLCAPNISPFLHTFVCFLFAHISSFACLFRTTSQRAAQNLTPHTVQCFGNTGSQTHTRTHLHTHTHITTR